MWVELLTYMVFKDNSLLKNNCDNTILEGVDTFIHSFCAKKEKSHTKSIVSSQIFEGHVYCLDKSKLSHYYIQEIFNNQENILLIL